MLLQLVLGVRLGLLLGAPTTGIVGHIINAPSRCARTRNIRFTSKHFHIRYYTYHRVHIQYLNILRPPNICTVHILLTNVRLAATFRTCISSVCKNGTTIRKVPVPYCSRSRRRAAKADKRMVLVHTHGLFIT